MISTNIQKGARFYFNNLEELQAFSDKQNKPNSSDYKVELINDTTNNIKLFVVTKR